MLFTPRDIVNGKMLRKFAGKNVSIFVNIESRDANGQVLNGKTTDNLSIRVNLAEPISQPINDWIEVIGIPAGPDAIRAKEIILFENEGNEPFDTDAHNMLVTFLHNCPEVYKVQDADNAAVSEF